MRHKMTLGHFSKDLIRPVSRGQSNDNEYEDEDSKQERSASLNTKQKRSAQTRLKVAPGL